MEEKARQIGQPVLTEEPRPPPHLGDTIRQRFAPFGGVEVPEVAREPLPSPDLPLSEPRRR